MTEQELATDLLRELESLAPAHLLVLGDLIVDRYTWGNAERISQEAPVVVLRADRRESRLGGGANVACMLRGLEARVTCAGVAGCDEAGTELRRLLHADGIDDELVITDSSRQTTVKERFIGRASARHPNQILRVDTESRAPLNRSLEDQLQHSIRSSMPRYQTVLISDYGKGVCTPALLSTVIAAGREAGVPVLVDPMRTDNYRHYRGATVLKPNRSETELVTGIEIRRPADAFAAGRQLCEELDLQMAVITLDRDGMALVPRHGTPHLFPTLPRNVYDITGAGDMVMAMLGLCWANGTTATTAAQLSNVAGSLEVEHTGVAQVTRDDIRAELLSRARPGLEKLLSVEALKTFGRSQREQGKRVVFTNGCFDLLHVGHVSYLEVAAAMGDVLVVGLNSDRSVQSLKGPDRPVIAEGDRAAMLAAMQCVDAVVIFDDATPHRLLHALRPDVLVKGGTYTTDEIVGREVVQAYGGEVRVTNVIDGISTSRIVKSLSGQASRKAPLSAGSQPPLREAG
jgi:D-beta-D-heptose 7-phosphate kinase/D-beta-D-heptose 1-phosphate adenosyltransferase